jgi:hypothetical protein
MKLGTRIAVFGLAAAAACALGALANAADEWTAKKPGDWTLEEVKQIVNVPNPWVKTIDAFQSALVLPSSGKPQETPVQAHKKIGEPEVGASKQPASASANGSTKVTLNLRWYSAGVIRQAGVRGAQLSSGISPDQAKQETRPMDRFYILALSAQESLPVLDTVPYDTLAKNTTLETDDGQVLRLANFRRPNELKGPEAWFYFDRAGKGISEKAKTATFKTEFNDAKYSAVFDLTKMVYMGKRDLDGDTGEISAEEKRRRDAQSAILAGADADLNRAVSDVLIDKNPDATNVKKPIQVFVMYDPSKELTNPAEAKLVDPMARMEAMSKNAGTWSAKNKSEMHAVIFVDPKEGKMVDYLLGADAEKLAKLEGPAAEKFFKENLKDPNKKAAAQKDSATAADAPKKDAPKAVPKKSK